MPDRESGDIFSHSLKSSLSFIERGAYEVEVFLFNPFILAAKDSIVIHGQEEGVFCKGIKIKQLLF